MEFIVGQGSARGRVVALAGGVGGAKLAHGLAGIDRPLSVIVNTADDFSLYGLHISPDLDTVTYTLGGIANPEAGWGVAGDTFVTLEMLRRYGEDTWFWLGDKDFATHILRTVRLRTGSSITDVTAEFAGSLDITARILPMCDEPVATLLDTEAGLLEFQDYFVRRQHADDVRAVQFKGIESARISEPVAAALDEAGIIVLCPSNPIVSIGPILAVPGMRERIRRRGGEIPIVAVSPIVGGQALKGPADRMLTTLGHEVSAVGVASLYRDFLTGLVIDEQDAPLAPRIEELGITALVTGTIMQTVEDRRRLADETLTFAHRLAEGRAGQ